jgi:serine/threonine protein kinase
MDLTGRHLGKYELLKRVGRGGMAYVYKAHQPTIDRFVAVKVLHSHLAEDAEFLERFKREAKGLGNLRHPHIVNVIDFDVDDGWYYMVMDFIEGETLETVLNHRGILRVDEALRLTAQLAGALAYAHENSRIHRDIKPGNVMFADDAQQHAVITDFGLTRLLDNATMTLSGTIAGTPAYMSPEAAQGQKVDGRSDIYSLGVMLYEMVTGQRPFSGETPLSVIMKLVVEPLPPALSVNPELPVAVDEILNKAMAKLPEDRYQSAAEMRQAILDCGLENKAETTSESEAEIAGTQLLTPQTKPDENPVLSHEPEPRQAAIKPQPAQKKSRLWLILAAVGLLVVALVAGFIVLNGADEDAVAAETAEPTSTIATTVTETAVSVTAGSLRFAEPDKNNLRQYTLSLNDVPPPPTGFHYELWFDFADQAAPENVAEVVAQNGRITYADVLVENFAANATGVRVSLEPDFDDDPSISTTIMYSGTVQSDTGLAEIDLFTSVP